MINVSTEEAQKRFRSIPEELQNAIFSPHNAEIIDKIAEENNLGETKQRAMAKLVGYVLLGYLDYKDDLTREIIATIGTKPEDAKKISDALHSRIFSSLKGELSLAYQPLSVAEGKGLPFQIGAIPIQQIESRKSMPTGGQIKVESAEPETKEVVKPAVPAIPAGAVTPAFVGTMAGKPAAISVNAPLPPAPPQPATSDMQHATNLTPPTLPTSPTIRTTPTSPTIPAPFILHQEAESQPLAQQKSKLSFQFTPSKDALQKDMGKPIEILKPKAQIEMGNEAESSKLKVESKSFFAPSGPAGTQQAPDAQRIVHYSAFRTPVYAPPPAGGESKVESLKFQGGNATTTPIEAKPEKTIPAPPSSTIIKTPITSLTPAGPAVPAAPPKMADIIAAGKPAPTTPQPPAPPKRVDYR